MVWQHIHTAVLSHLSFLLLKNFPKSPQLFNSSTQPPLPGAAKTNKTTKRSATQKNSVQCTMGATSISSLLYTMWCSGGFVISDRVVFSYFHCFGVFLSFSLPKLIIKPDSFLLKDKRSKASSTGHSQRVLLFIEPILPNVFYLLIIICFVSPQAVH